VVACNFTAWWTRLAGASERLGEFSGTPFFSMRQKRLKQPETSPRRLIAQPCAQSRSRCPPPGSGIPDGQTGLIDDRARTSSGLAAQVCSIDRMKSEDKSRFVARLVSPILRTPGVSTRRARSCPKKLGGCTSRRRNAGRSRTRMQWHIASGFHVRRLYSEAEARKNHCWSFQRARVKRSGTPTH